MGQSESSPKEYGDLYLVKALNWLNKVGERDYAIIRPDNTFNRRRASFFRFLGDSINNDNFEIKLLLATLEDTAMTIQSSSQPDISHDTVQTSEREMQFACLLDMSTRFIGHSLKEYATTVLEL